MTYKLYNRPGSAGMTIEAVFEMSKLHYQLITVDSIADQPLPDSFKAVNPWGQLPVLILPEGDTLTEVSAMLIYLTSRHPDLAIGPAPGTPAFGRYCRWIIFAAVNIHEAISRQLYPFRFTRNASTEDVVAEAAGERLHQALTLLDSELASASFLLGDQLSAADIYFSMFHGWTGEQPDYKNLARVTQHLRNHAQVGAVWTRHLDRIANSPQQTSTHQ